MINEKSVQAVKDAAWGEQFCRPLYSTYSFSKIPATVAHLLGVPSQDPLPADCFTQEKYDTVILCLIDGFGWSFLEKYHEKYPFLRRFFRQGIVSKITSQFPSTTAAHITTLCTGQEVGQTGIYEWYYYEPLLDRIMAPLLYSYAGDKKGSLVDKIHPQKLLPLETFFQKLAKEGIRSHIIQPASIAHSTYSNWMFRGAEMSGYKQFSDGLATLTSNLDRAGLFFLYFGDFDSQAHRHGIDSKQALQALDNCFNALERSFAEISKNPKTAFILSADHGMTSIHPQTTIYLNKQIPELHHAIKKGCDGGPLTPAGSCRDYFLHLLPDKIAETKQMLQEALEGKALVCDVPTLIANNFFGAEPVSSDFLKRVGDLVILAYDNHSIWWHEPGKFEQKFFAMHGGLTRDEMETIFLFTAQ